MSNIAIVQEYDRFTYFVDTAVGTIIDGELYRIRDNKAEKTHLVGNDIVFMSGGEQEINLTLTKMYDLLDNRGHIKTDNLQSYLQKKFPGALNPDKKFSQAGVAILSIIDGKTQIIGMTQGLNGCNDYQIIKVDTPHKGKLRLSVDGIENVFINEKIKECNKARHL